MELHAEESEKRYLRSSGEKNWFYAVQPVSCILEEGALTVLMGRSGSGKTTLLQMLAGLLPPSSGRVLADGQSLYEMSDRALSCFRNEHIAVIPQGQSAVASLTVLQNILLPHALYGNKTPDQGEALALMERLGIARLADVYPSELSGGELRRMAIARAVLRKTEILLADEPTGDLDDENSLLVLTMLKECAGAGKTVLLVTHENMAREYADVLLNMNAGTLSVRRTRDEPEGSRA